MKKKEKKQYSKKLLSKTIILFILKLKETTLNFYT